MTGPWAVTEITLLQITYQEEAGPLMPMDAAWLPRHYRVVDPGIGKTIDAGEWSADRPAIGASGHGPRAVIFHGGPDDDAADA